MERASDDRDRPSQVGGTATREDVERAFGEALEAIAAPHVAERILAEALAAAGLEEMPICPRAVEEFLRDHLHRAVAVVIGAREAETLRVTLAPILKRMAESEEITQVRSISKPDLEAVRAPATATGERRPVFGGADALPPRSPRASAPPQKPERVVVVTTTSQQRLELVADAVGELAFVTPVKDMMGLLDMATLDARRPPLVVLDCEEGTIQAETMVVLLEDLPKGTKVLLWGVPPGEASGLESLDGGVASWLRIAPGADAADVASLLGTIVVR